MLKSGIKQWPSITHDAAAPPHAYYFLEGGRIHALGQERSPDPGRFEAVVNLLTELPKHDAVGIADGESVQL